MLVIISVTVGIRIVNSVEYNIHLKDVCNVNFQTYNMISWGDCSSYHDINSITGGGYGHCGVYATLLDYRLREMGYTSMVVDIRSFSNDAVYSVVECIVDNRSIVLDPMNAVYYEYSVQELCDVPYKSNKKVFQTDKENIFEVYTEESFWAGVYQVKKYISTIYSFNNEYSYGYFCSINSSIKELYVNNIQYNTENVLDQDSKTNILFTGSNKIEILVGIEEDGADLSGIIGFDFTNLNQSLKGVKLYYKDRYSNDYILLKEYDTASNHYECYIGNINAEEYMLQGYAINENNEVQLDEIFLLEGVNAWDN